MGQGVHTSLAIIIGEELEVDPKEMRVVAAPADPAFGHSIWKIQGTGGSTSTWSAFAQLRQVGAQVRETFLKTAANAWGVSPEICRARDGAIETRDGRQRATYQELAERAAKTPLVKEPKLKSPDKFTRIGKPTPRVDSAAKVRGTAPFSYDRSVPGMLTAMVVRSPEFGGSLKSFDATRAQAVPGVKMVTKVPSGVAIVADGYWAAFKARDVLEVEWNRGPVAPDSAKLRTEFEKLSREAGNTARQEGDADAALGKAREEAGGHLRGALPGARADGAALLSRHPARRRRRRPRDGFAVPHHRPHDSVAGRLGVPPNKVSIQNSYLGGGFGRRANPKADFCAEAVEVALAAKALKRPIKTVWTREDDIHGGFYRPFFVNRMEAGLAGGKVTAWKHHIVGQSIVVGTAFEGAMMKDGVDQTAVEGAADMPYRIPNLRVASTSPKLPIPVLWWRSVGHSNTAFAKESFPRRVRRGAGQGSLRAAPGDASRATRAGSAS